MLRHILLTAVLIGLPGQLVAQSAAFKSPDLVSLGPGTYARSQVADTTAAPFSLAVVGIDFGAAGAFAGYYIGAHGTDSLGGGIAGAAIAESILLPFGVHLANQRRGSLSGGVLASLGIGAVGTAYVFSQWTDRSVAVAAVTVPIVQTIIAIAIERGTEP